MMLTLPPQPLPGEDSEGNILSLCAGKKIISQQSGFHRCSQCRLLSPHTRPSLPQIISTISIHIAQHAKQTEGSSLPSLHPDNSLSFMPKQTVGGSRDIFLLGAKQTIFPTPTPKTNQKHMVDQEAELRVLCMWVHMGFSSWYLLRKSFSITRISFD